MATPSATPVPVCLSRALATYRARHFAAFPGRDPRTGAFKAGGTVGAGALRKVWAGAKPSTAAAAVPSFRDGILAALRPKP